jgi:hypothetical protein
MQMQGQARVSKLRIATTQQYTHVEGHAGGSTETNSSISTGYQHTPTHTNAHLAEASARLAGAGHVARQALVHLTGAHEEAYGYDRDRIR